MLTHDQILPQQGPAQPPGIFFGRQVLAGLEAGLGYLRETGPGGCGPRARERGPWRSGVWVRLLVIGGTRFVGRAFVDLAVRQGHDVAVFHRSVSEPDDFPSVEHLHGDRDGQLDLLRGRSWDAVLDTCAYVPRAVREAAAVLRDAAGHYTLVSTLSVHPDDMPAGATERAAVHEPPFPRTETVTVQTYGPLKVACEHAAETAFGPRCLIIRPGYIVGPHDPSDRFTFYLRRAAGGGEMAAPGPPDAPLQVIDVRDLAAFMLARIEAGDGGVFGVVGPGAPIVMRDVLDKAREVAAADTTFTWLSEEFLHAAGDQAEEWFPMWEPQLPGVHTYDAAKAVAAGLRHRPFAQTVADTLAWDRQRGLPDLRTGLSADMERELLATWHSRP
jgi:nucleoside-diphosphate-sugar epimerase